MTVPTGPDPYREWDAAYVLGALGPQDRRAFEEHLASCEPCRAAVAELAGLPGILGGVDTAQATALVADDTADVVPLAAVARAARRRRTRRRGLLAVAATALLLVGGATGAALTGDPAGGDVVPSAGPPPSGPPDAPGPPPGPAAPRSSCCLSRGRTCTPSSC